MRKIVISGTSCTGKTTDGQEIAQRLGIQFIDIDDLHFLPGWIERTPTELAEEIRKTLAKHDAWVVASNYHPERAQIWEEADTIIWLDFSFWRVFGRAVTRTFSRAISREKVCNGNIETWSRVFSRNSIIAHVCKTYFWRKKHYPPVLEKYTSAGKRIVRLKTPRAAAMFTGALKP